MFKKLSRNAWITIAVIALIVIGGGAVSANHTMQVNHQKKVAADKLKAEKKNAEALASHVVVNGDTVQSVAKKFKENTSYMKKKFDLNKDDQLVVGTKISNQRAAIDKKKQDDANAAAAASAAQAAAQSQAVEEQRSYNSTSSSGTSKYQVPSSTNGASVGSGSSATASSKNYSAVPSQGVTYYNPNRQYADPNSDDVADMGAVDAYKKIAG